MSTQFLPNVDLSVQNPNTHIEYQGDASDQFMGSSIDFGNVGNSLKPDLIIGRYDASLLGNTNNGAIDVVFYPEGGPSPQAISSATGEALRVVGEQSGDNLGRALCGGPSFMVGGAFLHNSGQGAIYIVPASSTRGVLNLRGAIPPNVYKILGENLGDNFGYAIAVFDVDQNGKVDLISCAVTAQSGKGRCYVFWDIESNFLFLATNPLASLNGTHVLRIDGVTSGDHLATTIAELFNIHGDDSTFIAFGTPDAYNTAGVIYVVKGSFLRGLNTFDLTQLNGLNGFSIIGLNPGDMLYSIAAGFLNNDIFCDFLVGSYGASFQGLIRAGSASVFYGDVLIGNLGYLNLTQANVTIGGGAAGDNAGSSLRIIINFDGSNTSVALISATGTHGGAGEINLIRFRYLQNNSTISLAVSDGKGVTKFIGYNSVNEALGVSMAATTPTDGSIPQVAFGAPGGTPNINTLQYAGRVYYLPGGCSNFTPVLENNRVTVQEGGTTILDSTMLSARCNGILDPNIVFKPNAQNGFYSLTSSPTVQIQQFNQQQVLAGQVQVTHSGILPFSCQMVVSSNGFAADSIPQTTAVTFLLKPPITNYLPVFQSRATPISSANLAADKGNVTFIVNVTSGGKFSKINDLAKKALNNFTDGDTTPPTNIEFDAISALPTGTVFVTDGQHSSPPVPLGFTSISTPQCSLQVPLDVKPTDDHAIVMYRADGTGNFRCTDITQSDFSQLQVTFGGIMNSIFENLLTSNPQNTFTQAAAAQGAVGIFFGKAASLIFEAGGEIVYNFTASNGYTSSNPVLGQVTCTVCVASGTATSSGLGIGTIITFIFSPLTALGLGLGAMKWWDNGRKSKSETILKSNLGDVKNNPLHEVGRTWENDAFREFFKPVINKIFDAVRTRARMKTRTKTENDQYFNSIMYIINEAGVTQQLYKSLTSKQQESVVDVIVKKIIAVAESPWWDWGKPWLLPSQLSSEKTSGIAKKIIAELADIIPAFKEIKKAQLVAAGKALFASVNLDDEPTEGEREESANQPGTQPRGKIPKPEVDADAGDAADNLDIAAEEGLAAGGKTVPKDKSSPASEKAREMAVGNKDERSLELGDPELGDQPKHANKSSLVHAFSNLGSRSNKGAAPLEQMKKAAAKSMSDARPEEEKDVELAMYRAVPPKSVRSAASNNSSASSDSQTSPSSMGARSNTSSGSSSSSSDSGSLHFSSAGRSLKTGKSSARVPDSSSSVKQEGPVKRNSNSQ